MFIKYRKKEKCKGQWRIEIKEESKETEKIRASVDANERGESERSIGKEKVTGIKSDKETVHSQGNKLMTITSFVNPCFSFRQLSLTIEIWHHSCKAPVFPKCFYFAFFSAKWVIFFEPKHDSSTGGNDSLST